MTTIKSAYDYAIPKDLMKNEIPKASKVPWFIKHNYVIQANSEQELIDRIANILDEAGIPYTIDQLFMTIHIRYRCTSGECMLRIYKNEGEYMRTTENGNFIVEHDNLSRELFHKWIFWFLEDILLNRNQTIPRKLAAYIRDLEKGFSGRI